MARQRRKAVAFIYGRFPAISETFLLREMNALAAMGLDIIPLALAPGDEVVHPDARAWLERVIYRPRGRPMEQLAAAASCCFRWPMGVYGAGYMAWSLAWRHPLYSREISLAFLAACYFARRLAGRICHVHATFASIPATVGLFLAELLDLSFSFAGHARDVFTREGSFLPLKVSEAEFVVVCSEAAMRALSRHHPPDGRIHLIRHGVDTSKYALLGETHNPVPRIVSVGRLVPKKGFDHLLDAVSILLSRDVEVELFIVGDGPLRGELERKARGLGLQDLVHFVGPLAEDELLRLYGAMDLAVLASCPTPDGDTEGVPNVLIEAMALGIPVVATAVGGIPELVEDGRTGLLAKPGDADDLARKISRLLADAGLRMRLRSAARAKVEREYNLFRNASRLYELFRRVVGS